MHLGQLLETIANRDARPGQLWMLAIGVAVADTHRPDLADRIEALYAPIRPEAANTAWWLRHRGGRILLASHNGHISYVSESRSSPSRSAPSSAGNSGTAM
ncbi:hypothetical protein [Streptomyces sp. NPDC020917]|uniref:hypothetical protein n=1 Tax=Streptomyces sp. NPDC020917 TaxID=3365102 RepID=UPI00379C7A6A